MSEARRRTPGEPGWLATAGGALLLVVVGFAVGLVAGAAFEEPDLVIEQLAGRGAKVPVEEVELTPAGESPSEPLAAVAAAPPAAGGPEPAAPSSQSPAGAARAPRSGFAVQVGAFADEDAARRLAGELSRLGLRGYVSRNPEDARVRWRVRAGPWASEDEARRIATRLKTERQLPTWVLQEPGR